MSDTSKPTKISREGVILIKSFEGFRPRAIQRADGRWTIGYGHTQSAREGLTVSESDAELLLQYDLIPVAQTVKAVQAPLNQHQFDALASFAFSVGVDRFKTSNVLARLNAGAPLEAADALMSWVEDADVVTPPRRRAAERALFVADPETPASLADLLAAPLPPATATLVESTVEAEPSSDEAETESTAPAPFPAFPPSLAMVETPEAPPPMTREAAVSALLGDVEEAGSVEAVEESPKTETSSILETPPSPSETNVDGSVEAAASDVTPEETPVEAEEGESVQAADGAVEPSSPAAPALPSPGPASPVMTSAATFYSPYAVRALGPLSGFGIRAPRPAPAPAPASAANDAPPADLVSGSPETPSEEAAADLPAAEMHAETKPTPEPEAGPTEATALFATSDDAEQQIEVADEAEQDEAAQAIDAPTSTSPLEPTPAVVSSEPPVEVPTFVSAAQPTVAPFEAAPLALTGAPEAQPSSTETRLVWPEDNDLTHPDQTPLFEQEATLVEQESAAEPSARPTAPSFKFEWTETLTFLVMGGIGLLSFGAAMAAFRQSSQSNGDTGLIGWLLVVIALACVSVSGFNLYQRWGRVDRA
ncbi:MAG: glycoside hydrolase family protein [Brevundimonas sp.]